MWQKRDFLLAGSLKNRVETRIVRHDELAAFIAEETRALNVAPVPAAAALFEPQADDEPAVCEGCAAATVFNPAMRGEP